VLALGQAAARSEPESRALAFATLVLADLGLLLGGRSLSGTVIGALRHPNKPLWVIGSGALVLLALVLAMPGLRELFRFAPLTGPDFIVVVAVALLTTFTLDLSKLVRRRSPGRRVTRTAAT
jgi:Ca2+-transporting ATPase